MSNKKKTFKMRARKTDLRQRNVAKSDIRKRVGGRQRTHNRYDAVDNGSRPMQEIVNDIANAVAIPSQEFDLDPRSLTNLLLRPAAPVSASAKTTNGATPSPQSSEPPSGAAKYVTSKTTGKHNASVAPGAPLPAAKVLPVAPLASDDPLALPDVLALEEAEHRRREAEAAAKLAGENKNQYRHHGQAYLFWERLGLHPRLLQALRAMKFSHPTPVQQEVLPAVLEAQAAERKRQQQSQQQERSNKKKGAQESTAVRRKAKNSPSDIVVSAETGSGKTLVFALPILHELLTQLEADGRLCPEAPTTPTAETDTPGKKRTRTADAHASHDQEDTRGEPQSDARATTHTASKGTGHVREGKKTKSGTSAPVAATKASAPTPPSTVPKLSQDDFHRQLMHALIVSPTRELALQINDAMRQLIKFAPEITVGCIVGGMAAEKQQRVLNRHPHILICTPGRLWELTQRNEGCYLGHSISRRLHHVVLDEADKLLQSGRFEQLQELLARIHSDVLPAGFEQGREEGAEVGETEVVSGRWDAVKQNFVPYTAEELAARGERPSKAKAASEDSGSEDPDEEDDDEEGDEDDDDDAEAAAPQPQRRAVAQKDQPHPIPMPAAPRDDHRVLTTVTSATLSLQTNYERKDFKSNKSIIRTSNADTMNKVLLELDLKPNTTKVFNMGEQATVVAKINETYLRCPEDSKDLYLYYFLKTYPGERTIIFVNAISMLRRLVKILEILGVPVAGLHASMQQRQRLKFVDKFKSGAVQVLVATDIASRGLDIEGLKYVVHFQVPRSTDAYIHRCGRTARCGGTGLSLLMVSAQEYVSFKKLLESLGRPEKSMETFALQPIVVHQLHPHLRLALQIDKLQREIGKSRASNTWVTRMSKAADIEVDDMFDDEADNVNREKMKAIKILSRELQLMVKKFTGAYGGKGSFRTGAQALGAREAEQKLRERADFQTLKTTKKSVMATPAKKTSSLKAKKSVRPKVKKTAAKKE